MAMQDLPGQPLLYPKFWMPSATGVPGFATTTCLIDAAGEKIACVFFIHKAGVIETVEFQLRSVTFNALSVARISLQDASLVNGDPDGVQDQFRDLTGLTTGWVVPGRISADGTDTGLRRTVAVGDILVFVLEFQAFTAADSLTLGAPSNPTSGEENGLPFTDLFTASWAKSATQVPGIVLKYSDGTYSAPLGCVPVLSVADQSFNSGSTPDERALLFRVPVPMRVCGARWRGSVNAGGDHDLVLYDAAGTALRTASRDGDVGLGAGILMRSAHFTSPLDLAANVDYRLALKPTTITSVTIEQATFATAAIANAYVGGPTAMLSTRTDGGAWTETATVLPMMSLLVHGLDDGVQTGATAPTAPTLAMADNADGTGGVATITAGDAGSTHAVQSQTVDGELGTATWTTRGSRTGNGTVAVAPGNGYYWWRVLATSAGGSAVSNLVYQPMTSGTLALYDRILTAVQARIRSLALTGVANGSVLIRKTPWDRDAGTGKTYAYPLILVSSTGQEEMNPAAGSNAKDDVGYPVLIGMVALDNQHQTNNRERYLRWREAIARAFRHARLPGIGEVYDCVVEPNAVVDAPNWIEHNLWTSFLVLRFVSRESRGFGT